MILFISSKRLGGEKKGGEELRGGGGGETGIMGEMRVGWWEGGGKEGKEMGRGE